MTDLIRHQTPEEQELEAKLRELDSLENELAEKELALATLESELKAFETEYMRQVGVKYAELDRLQAQIAEAEAKDAPDSPEKQQRAQAARQQAEESAEAAGQIDLGRPTPPFEPSETLKNLFRKLVKKYHPDKGRTPEEKSRFAEFFKAINEAYQSGDETRLRELEREIESSPESVTGDTIGDQLIRTIRTIAQVRNRIAAVTREIEELTESELSRLRMQIDEAKASGRDLLAEMAAQVQQDIAQAKQTLASRST